MSFMPDYQDMKIGAEQLTMHESFADEFVCKICLVHVVGCGPKLTTCSHLFCGDCLQQWFTQHPNNQTWAQRAKSGGSVPCPVCKTALHKETDIFSVEKHGDGNSAMLWRMIQSLEVKCDGRQCEDGCCGWTGELGSFRQHLQSGTCGKIQNAIEPMLSEEAPTESVAVVGLAKELLSSPSTCSLCSPANSSAEEWSTDCMSEVSGDEHKDVALAGSSGAIATTEASGQDLTSLICALIDINTIEAVDHGNSPIAAGIVPEDCLEFMERLHDQAAAVEAVGASKFCPEIPFQGADCSDAVEKSQYHAEATMHLAHAPGAKSKKPKKSKPKAKNWNHCENAGQAKDARERAQAAYQWQVHQWQAAQYHMAYAQRYQMAMQAMRMQQAAQYQPQNLRCVR
jgi:hypothetical protein